MTPPTPLVAVTWLDAHGTATAAYSLHEIPHAAISITTYGLLLRQDDAGISVASEFCADGTYRGVTFVPTGMVVRVEHVKKSRKRAAKPVAEVAP